MYTKAYRAEIKARFGADRLLGLNAILEPCFQNEDGTRISEIAMNQFIAGILSNNINSISYIQNTEVKEFIKKFANPVSLFFVVDPYNKDQKITVGDVKEYVAVYILENYAQGEAEITKYSEIFSKKAIESSLNYATIITNDINEYAVRAATEEMEAAGGAAIVEADAIRESLLTEEARLAEQAKYESQLEAALTLSKNVTYRSLGPSEEEQMAWAMSEAYEGGAAAAPAEPAPHNSSLIFTIRQRASKAISKGVDSNSILKTLQSKFNDKDISEALKQLSVSEAQSILELLPAQYHEGDIAASHAHAPATPTEEELNVMGISMEQYLEMVQ